MKLCLHSKYFNLSAKYLGLEAIGYQIEFWFNSHSKITVNVHVYAALFFTKLKPKIKGAAYICVWSSQKPN